MSLLVCSDFFYILFLNFLFDIFVTVDESDQFIGAQSESRMFKCPRFIVVFIKICLKQTNLRCHIFTQD